MEGTMGVEWLPIIVVVIAVVGLVAIQVVASELKVRAVVEAVKRHHDAKQGDAPAERV
jgi:hypothetical protein